ncbi:MAG: thioredoxin family protein [Bacteroidales bacterium]|jgi:thioredoxin|nr:thioredoxin family protein [Bacteroidales bacterium]
MQKLMLSVALLALILSTSCKHNHEADDNAVVQEAVETGSFLSDKTNGNLSDNQNTAEIKEDLSGDVQMLSDVDFVTKITEVNNEKGFQYKGNTPCVVDFYADWCGYCVRLVPIMEKLSEKYKGKVIFYKINVDKAPGIAMAFDINALPTQLLFKPNQQPVSMVGAPTLEELDKAIQEVLL